MSDILDAGNAAFRDYVTNGVPSSGANDPEKADIRAFVAAVDSENQDRIAEITALQVTAGTPGLNFDTLADAEADTAHAANTVAFVNFDSTPANNGKYILTGSPTLAWVKTDDRVDALATVTQASDATLSRRQVLDQRAQRKRVLWIGDSIGQRNVGADSGGAGISYQALGEVFWARTAWPHFELDQWNDTTVSAGGKWSAGMIEAISSSQTSDVLTRLAADVKLAPQVAGVSIGINDLINAVANSTIEANIDTIVNTLVTRGIQVILTTVRPVGASVLASLTNWTAINTYIRTTYANKPGVTLWDVAAIYDDGTGRPISGTLESDATHPNAHGAFIAGCQGANGIGPLSDVMQALCKATPLTMVDDGENLAPNPRLLSASGGTAGTGATGTVPADWQVSNLTGSGTATVNVSTAANGDTGGNLLSLDITSHGTGFNPELISFQQLSRQSMTAYVGQWVKSRVKLLVNSTNTLLLRGIEWQIDPGAGAGTPENTSTDHLTASIDQVVHLETPPYQIKTSPGAMLHALYMYLDATVSGTANIQVLEVETIVVDDPKRLHGVTY